MAMGGSKAAKEILYKQYSVKMFNICIRMTGNQNDAEDMLQNAYISAFQNIAQLKSPLHFEVWLRKIVIYECLKYLKQQRLWVDVSEVDVPEEQQEDSWYLSVPIESIHLAIKELPNGCREIFTLYAIEDYSHNEIASLLGCSVSTSKSQYYRAKLLLRELIKSNNYGRI